MVIELRQASEIASPLRLFVDRWRWETPRTSIVGQLTRLYGSAFVVLVRAPWELVTGPLRSRNLFEAESGLQVCEEDGDVLAFVARSFELGRMRHLMRVLACVFMDG